MYYDFLIEIPENTGKISKNKRGETTYIEYTYERKYIPEKKYNVAKRTTIGKMCPDQPHMMYPNPNFTKYFPTVDLPQEERDVSRSSCIKVGGYLVLKKIIEDYQLSDMLSNHWDDRGKGLLLDLAVYSIITEGNAAQHYESYTYNHPLMTPNHHGYSDSTISRFFAEISVDDRVRFLNTWNQSHNHKEKIYISYDSTNKNCKAGDISMAEYGYAKEQTGAPIINYAIAYDMNNEKPLFYESYPGSIVDVSQLQHMLEKATGYGYKNIGFILDRGYFSKDNINYMDANDYDFIMMVKGKASFVKQLITAHRGEFEAKRKHVIKEYRTYGTTVERTLYADDKKIRYFHLYHKSGRENAERTQLETTLERMTETMDRYKGKEMEFGKQYQHYFHLTYHEKNGVRKFYGYEEREDVIEEELNLCGYFTIVTSEKMTAKEALLLYKSRDTSEKVFCSDKSFLGNRSLRVVSTNSAESKIFVEFLAIIIRNRLYTLLKKRMAEMSKKSNFMTVPAALRELEKIELIRRADGSYFLDHAITATQKTILGAIGLEEMELKNQALEVGKELMNATSREKYEEDEYDGTCED